MFNKEKPLLEFVMTYGWVAMVAFGTIGALSYFDFLNLSNAGAYTGSVVMHGVGGNFQKYSLLLLFVLILISLFFYFKYIKKHLES